MAGSLDVPVDQRGVDAEDAGEGTKTGGEVVVQPVLIAADGDRDEIGGPSGRRRVGDLGVGGDGGEFGFVDQPG
jgi:hypothetical protein